MHIYLLYLQQFTMNNYSQDIAIDPVLIINQDSTQTQNCRCPICHQIFNEPKACANCLNHFCSRCIYKWTLTKPRQCPLCKNFTEMRAVPILKNLLSKLKFNCPNNNLGCHQILSYDHFIAHNKSCDFEIIVCTNTGCTITSPRCDISKHDKICKYKIEKCIWCQTEKPRHEMNTHQKNCNQKIQKCMICKESFKLIQIPLHMNVCPLKQESCKWCKSKILFKQLKEHQSTCQERKVSCLGCKQIISLIQFYDHQNKCSEYPIVCIRCNQNICRKDFSNHTVEKCIEYINNKYLQDTTYFKNQQNQLKEKINSLEKKQFQYEQILQLKTAKFSLIKKDPDIFVNKGFAAVRQHKKKRRDRYALIEIQNLSNKKYTWKLKTLVVQSEWFAVGMTEQSNVYLTRRYQNIGHFSYLISANGIIYSSHNENQNQNQTDFSISQNQIIQCTFDPQKAILIIHNLTKNKKVDIQLDMEEIKKKNYYPSVCLRCGGDSIQIINDQEGKNS